MGIVVAALLVTITVPLGLVAALRKRCPACGKKELAFNGGGMSGPESPEPRKHKLYRCASCRAEFASPDRDVFVPKPEWDKGVRVWVPRATVKRS